MKPVEYGNYFLKGLVEIQKSVGPTDFTKLTYTFKEPNLSPIAFIGFKGPQHIFKDLR